MTARELLTHGTEILEDAGVAESASDAWILLEHVTGLDRAHYYLEMNSQTAPENAGAADHRGSMVYGPALSGQ